MSPAFRRDAGHDRARELAAIRVDEPLGASDAAWLDAHLLTCAACAAVADAYDADRLLFGALRDVPPMPPRDLWARTAAAIDAESGASRGTARGRRILGFPAISLAPLAGLAVVAVVVGSGLLNGSPVVPGPGGQSVPPPTPIAFAPGDVAVLTRGADGTYQVQTGVVDEVCPIAADTCAAAPSFEATQLARIGSSDSVGAIISPSRDHLVVVQRGATGVDGVYVVPVKPVPDDAGIATPTALPTASPSTAVATATPASSAEPTASNAATAPAPTTAGPDATPSVVPTEAPTVEPSAAPTVEPSAAPTVEPSAASTVEPSAAPIDSPAATPEPTPEPTSTVAVTPAPGGDAIQIASDVVVVGGIAAYNADGTRFAFTARPSDGTRGPDVYVWDTSKSRASAVTTDHRSIFAGWDGKDLMVSRIVDGTPRTFSVSARTGSVRDQRGHAVWLPTVAPGGTRAAWWDGSVDLADDDLTWVPDKGRLVLGAWPGTQGDTQVLAKGPLSAWEVRWNEDGTVIGVWTAGADATKAGRLSLYPVDPDTGRAQLGDPILDDVPAFAGFALEDGRLVYPGPGSESKRSLWVVAWDGASVGRVELPGEGAATVIR